MHWNNLSCFRIEKLEFIIIHHIPESRPTAAIESIRKGKQRGVKMSESEEEEGKRGSKEGRKSTPRGKSA